MENENREVSGDDTDGSGDGAGCNLFSPASSHFCDIFRATSQQNPPNQPRRRKTVRATLMSELFLNKQSILTDFRPSCYCFHFIVSSVTTRCKMSDISTTRELIESKPVDAHEAMMFMSEENCSFIDEISAICAVCS